MYYRSCELAHEVDATLWLPIGACIHGWGVEPALEVFEDFLPAHMVLKCKERGHSTLHPSVTQCVFMWCWRSSLQSPDLEELEALL